MADDRQLITVVGAGLCGLTAALRLAQAGYRVRVHERYPAPGGLARVFEVGGERLESFYHHLFTTDLAYVELARELGLADEIEWLPSRMGIWTDGRLWDFGTPMSLLRFRPLGWIDKLRFVAWTLLLQRRQSPEPFEHVTAAEWIRRHQGLRVWERVWGPLFHQKFSSDAESVAMVWLWCKLRLRGRSRSASGMGERLGYMRGSFARLPEALVAAIEARGGEICLRDPVRSLAPLEEGVRVETRSGTYVTDRALVAAAIPEYLELVGEHLPAAELARLQSLRATGALCTVLELDRSLTPYYWLNVADASMPFGGVIEHTNYIPRERYGGRHIVYLSNYLFPDDPMFRAGRKQVMDSYVPALQRLNPAFEPSWIQKVHHFRAEYAQPVVTVGYRRLIPSHRTPVPGVYLAAMAQIFPEDRGQNYAISSGDTVARLMIDDLCGSSQL